jgi:hypothetical protein
MLEVFITLLVFNLLQPLLKLLHLGLHILLLLVKLSLEFS